MNLYSGGEQAGHDVDGLVPVDVRTPGVPGGTPAEPAPRRARVTWACDLDYEPPVYAWEDGGQGRVPVGSLSIAAGREGTGKSSFGVWLCARVTTGTLPGVWHGTPGRVLYAAVEDSWTHTLLPRLIAAGADLSRVGRFDVVVDEDTETSLSLPFDNELLETALVENKIRLVVLDPLMSMIGAGIDTHRERDVRTALDPLARMADRTGAVLLGIAHFNKGSGSDAASLITGSGAFKNVPRTVFGFARDEADDGGRVMTQVKNSTGRDDLPSLAYTISTAEVPTPKGTASTALFTFTGTSERSVRDLLRDARGGNEDPDQDDRQAVESWLRELLEDKGHALPANDVYKHAAAAGFSRDQAKRAKSRLGVRAVKGATSWAWQLPEGGTDPEQPGACSLAPLLPSQVTGTADNPQEGKGAREQGRGDAGECTSRDTEGATKVPKVPASQVLAPSAPSEPPHISTAPPLERVRLCQHCQKQVTGNTAVHWQCALKAAEFTQDERRPHCTRCGQELLLVIAGRDICAACSKGAARAATRGPPSPSTTSL